MAESDVRSFSAGALKRVVRYEAFGFGVAVIACWATEAIDPPFSWSQPTIMTLLIVALGAATMYWTTRFVKRIRFLEGFLVICAGCKKVRIEQEWIEVDRFLKMRSDLLLSHGMCPDCIDRFYGEELRKLANR